MGVGGGGTGEGSGGGRPFHPPCPPLCVSYDLQDWKLLRSHHLVTSRIVPLSRWRNINYPSHSEHSPPLKKHVFLSCPKARENRCSVFTRWCVFKGKGGGGGGSAN